MIPYIVIQTCKANNIKNKKKKILKTRNIIISFSQVLAATNETPTQTQIQH